MIERLMRISVLVGLMMVAFGVGKMPSEAQEAATPTAALTSALEVMLGFAPDVVSAFEESQFQIASYADPAAQLAAVGITAPEGETPSDDAISAWISAINWLTFPESIVSRNQEWRAVFGFDLYQADQTLVVGQPPSQIVMLRGRFDPVAIETALTTAGYQTIDVSGAVIYSLNPEPEIDFRSEIGRLALANMNNVAILSDGTLVSAASLDLVQRVVAVAAGTAPSLADRLDVQVLLQAQGQVEPLVSALLMGGGAFVGMPIDVTDFVSGTPPALDTAATRMAEISEMPPILMALLGTTAGGPLFSRSGDVARSPADTDVPEARFDINLLMLDPASAETAVAVATGRLETGQSIVTDRPYTEFFSVWQGETVDGTTVARLEIEFAAEVNPGIWLQMLYQRDLGFIAW